MKTELNIHSDSLHTCAVITGFYMLAEQGETELAVNDRRHDEKISDAVICAETGGKKIVFDLNDGYCYDDINCVEKYFSEADVIFKRSYSKEKN